METRLLKEAAAAGCETLGGLDMLVAQAEDQSDRGRHHARERNAEEHGDAEPVRQIGRGERPQAEEGGMADRDLAGEADHDVEAEGGDAEDADLDQQAEGVFAKHVRRKADQHDADNHCVAPGPGREHACVFRIAGAEIAGGNEGGRCHDYTRSMSLVPNRP